MVQQREYSWSNDLRIKLNKDIGSLLNRCKTPKFRLLCSTDLLLLLGGASDVSRPAYVLLRKINGCFYAKDNFEHKLSKDAQ